MLPAYLRLYHLTATPQHLTHSLPVHSVRLLSTYYASPTFDAMRAGLESEGGSSAEPQLQPTFIHLLCERLDALFSSLRFDAKLTLSAPVGATPPTAAADDGHNPLLCDEQRRILYGAFLAFHGISPSSKLAASTAAGAELLPFIAAHLATLAGPAAAGGTAGSQAGLHAMALRYAALGAEPSPWAQAS